MQCPEFFLNDALLHFYLFAGNFPGVIEALQREDVVNSFKSAPVVKQMPEKLAFKLTLLGRSSPLLFTGLCSEIKSSELGWSYQKKTPLAGYCGCLRTLCSQLHVVVCARRFSCVVMFELSYDDFLSASVFSSRVHHFW